jgi:hypothetical protein
MTNFINANLKKEKHVSDNCWGFVVDTLAYSVSGLPVGFSARKKGDTSESQLLSLVLSQISPAADANQRDALQGLGIDADRGYWKWKLLATFMHLGANSMRQARDRQAHVN